MKRKIVFTGMAAFAALSMSLGATTAFASTGQDQYTNNPLSCDGAIHGAFANTNGNFGSLGQEGGVAGHWESQGLPPNQTGLNNSAASASCNATN
jgi:hypothetical protein